MRQPVYHRLPCGILSRRTHQPTHEIHHPGIEPCRQQKRSDAILWFEHGPRFVRSLAIFRPLAIEFSGTVYELRMRLPPVKIG